MPRATPLRLKAKLVALLLLPVTLYLIPLDGIYNGESICLFKRCLGIECWGCGITRAFFSALYGKFTQAWAYNPLIIIIFPLLLWLWGKATWLTVKRIKCKSNFKKQQ